MNDHMIGKPKCLPFQRHVIHCNRLLLNGDTALWIWLGHKSNLTKFNIFTLTSQYCTKTMEWKQGWWSGSSTIAGFWFLILIHGAVSRLFTTFPELNEWKQIPNIFWGVYISRYNASKRSVTFGTPIPQCRQ